MKVLHTPITNETINQLEVGDMVLLSGEVLCGRDAVLPKLITLLQTTPSATQELHIEGSVIFHTAVSVAGVGPTSSNKLEIESSIAPLSKLGVKLHLGKGAIKQSTIDALAEHQAVFAVIPPVTALLEEKTLQRNVLAFPEEGMEALHSLQVQEYPVIIAAAHGRSIY